MPVARDALLSLATEAEEAAALAKRQRKAAWGQYSQPDGTHDYRDRDVRNLRRRGRQYLRVAKELRRRGDDPDALAGLVEAAREAAWADVESNLERRLRVEGMRPESDPDYERMRAARMQSLRLVDLERLAAQHRAADGRCDEDDGRRDGRCRGVRTATAHGDDAGVGDRPSADGVGGSWHNRGMSEPPPHPAHFAGDDPFVARAARAVRAVPRGRRGRWRTAAPPGAPAPGSSRSPAPRISPRRRSSCGSTRTSARRCSSATTCGSRRTTAPGATSPSRRDADADWQLIAELIDASYRSVANRRQLRALDADPVVPTGR